MILGHNSQWEFLQKAVKANRLPHAFLFWGVKHLGKKTVAKEFVKFLNCEDSQKSNKPCDNCRSCQDFQKETHPDLLVLAPETKEIKIPQIRKLQHFLSFRPYSAKYKSVIIDEAAPMNQEAQSCLLKTLEEPTDSSILFLIAEHSEAFFSTILSRVQKIRFSSASQEEIRDYLKKKNVPLAKIEAISSFSFGRPGLSIRFSEDPAALELVNQRIKEISVISRQPLFAQFQYVSKMDLKKQGQMESLEAWLRYFRDKLRIKIGLKPDFKNLPSAPNFSFPQIKKIINSIERINYLISSTNINQRLAIESIMLQFENDSPRNY